MSRGLSGWEAEEIYRRAMEKKALEKERGELQKRVDREYKSERSEDQVLMEIRPLLKRLKGLEWTKIWHGNEAKSNEPGVPDILGVVSIHIDDLVELCQRTGRRTVGLALALEVKGTKTPIQGDQVQFIHKWAEAGAIVGFPRSARGVHAIFKEYGFKDGVFTLSARKG